jgi:hypothetical protein
MSTSRITSSVSSTSSDDKKEDQSPVVENSILDWEDYNQTADTDITVKFLVKDEDPFGLGMIQGCTRVKNTGGKIVTANSFAQVFMRQLNLESYLYNADRSILQFGCSKGYFLGEYKAKGWRVKGYDYSLAAGGCLSLAEIPYRHFNLNTIYKNEDAEVKDQGAELKSDIASHQNIIAIRIFEYLNPDALKLLLFSIIDHSKPETRFIFASHSIKPGYVPSFFGGRTDFETLFHAKQSLLELELVDKVGNNYTSYSPREENILVVRKRG